jgi:hypothetical protein
VGGGTYNYGQVNIVKGGTLKFVEATNTLNMRIEFWANSILVENEGSLIAGGAPPATPFGTFGGVLTIHLYGRDQGVGGVGITCKSNNSAIDPPCGIPDEIWKSNETPVDPCVKSPLPGGVSDCFYRYGSPPFDDGKDANGNKGHFGYKVLAVSYGGTLQLFGNKGAVYGASLEPKDSGMSWVRLMGTILGTIPSTVTDLTVASPVNWKAGDHIVVTTTDYLPNHSEELVICEIKGNTISFDAAINAPNPCPPKPGGVRQGVEWTHNGEQFSLAELPSRLNITKTAAETRAAVGLLTRSIRIVSEGDAFGVTFPAPPPPSINPVQGYYFGGHTIVRQGFLAFQVQGVEFRQLGEGGRLGHYPVHFHMVRTAPPNTFVTDSSINESMTRWITVHGTQNVTLARNVGYLSIGHGFYLEDAVETKNQFYSNLGIFARAAIANAHQNPRRVPGILASSNDTPGTIKYGSDKDTPAVFWITNGWNDFQGNMAAGAGMCGACYWQVPASIGGHSRNQQWESYASMQKLNAGTSPLMTFDGNYCTSAMTSFQTVGFTLACPGVGIGKRAVPVMNPNAPNSGAPPSECGPTGSNKNWPICPADYYPNTNDGELEKATKCPDTGPCTDSNGAVVDRCDNLDETNCLPTVINNYTTSFNWAQYNFAAIWLRARWHLISNSFISDVQNAGLTLVGGGDYTRASAIRGLWNLALKTVFVGQTQPADKAHAFASVLSPFNADTGLTCDNPGDVSHCISVNNSITLGGFAAFGVSEHLFNIYDGPADQDSNAYLAIKKTDLMGTTTPPTEVYKNVNGIPKSVQLNSPPTPAIPVGNCYIQNAAIAWKQPNGFYYPPTFHSNNLFFKNVDIRHYVIVPQFVPNTYKTAPGQQLRYCTSALDMFGNFSSIDRQTVLTDDDGSLTGYAKTISVNEDPFFKAPIEGLECRSDGATPEGGTARTSPYEYVTTVVYPEDAQNATTPPPPPPLGLPKTCRGGPYKVDPDPDWDSDCTNQNCIGVPLYREYQTGKEHLKAKLPEFIRMAGFNLCQRQTMSINHGHYYVDLTASRATQSMPISDHGCPPCPPPGTFCPVCPSKNIFIGGKTYDFFLVHARPETEQTYQMFVGPGFNQTDVKLIRANIKTSPIVINPEAGAGHESALQATYDGKILTVKLNLSTYAKDFADEAKAQCVPRTVCQPMGSKCVGIPGNTLFANLTQAERDIACGYAGKDVDCPLDPGGPSGKRPGCVGFSVALPAGFVAQDQTTNMGLLPKLARCFPKNDPNWNVTPVLPKPPGLAGACVGAAAPISADFCP